MPPKILPSGSYKSICSRSWRRCLATNASEAAEQLMHKFRGKTIVRKQILDANQLQRLCLTLGRPTVEPGLDITKEAPPEGTPIPPGYHLVYFTPADLERSLGPDGTDLTFNAPAPFSRRMWAGGRMTWEKEVRLRVGDVVEEHTTLLGATPKRSRNGSEMVLVDVCKEFRTAKGRSLVDQRSWIFRPPAKAPAAVVREDQEANLHVYQPSISHDMTDNAAASVPERHMRWSPVALFRFSALTFNAHMIHYNETWTKTVEGHPGVVVHGPLNLINMLDYWRDHHSPHSSEIPRSIAYRALSPVYAGEDYVIKTTSPGSDAGQPTELVIDKAGAVCMTGTVTPFA